MDLNLKDILELFEVPEKTVLKWIAERKLPAYRIKNQYYFNRAEINEWILSNNISVSRKVLDIGLTRQKVSLLDLVRRGGIHYSIDGASVPEIIDATVATIPVPRGTDRETVRRSLLMREEMMPTAAGRGIAFPHPRNPIITDVSEEMISLCFLKNRIEYGALDGIPVDVLFTIISSNAKRHLEILARLSFLCKEDDFVRMIHDQPKADVIFYHIEQKEKEWSER